MERKTLLATLIVPRRLWRTSLYLQGQPPTGVPPLNWDKFGMQFSESGSSEQGPIAVVVTLVLIKGSSSQFLPLIQTNAAKTLADEPECHRFDICLNPEIPEEILLYEIYASRGAFEVHLASEHFRVFDEASSKMVASKSARIYQLSRQGSSAWNCSQYQHYSQREKTGRTFYSNARSSENLPLTLFWFRNPELFFLSYALNFIEASDPIMRFQRSIFR